MKYPAALRAVPDGRELVSALSELFPDRVGWVMASGIVDELELSVIGRDADSLRSIRGRFLLTTFSGPLGGPYGATLSRMDGDRLELLSGVLLRARAQGVKAMFLPSEGAGGAWAAPEREAPPVTRVEVAAEAPKGSLVESTWGAAVQAAVSAAAPVRSAPEPVAEPEPGDLIDHFAFGLCEVLTATGDRLQIRDLSRGGRAREIRTDVLVLHAPIEQQGKRVFRLSRRS